MNIELKRNYGHCLIIQADNVKIEEDIEERIYSKGVDGKTDFNIAPARDIKEEYIAMFDSILSDMIYYREKPYDSSDLIKSLFEKLDPTLAADLAHTLFEEYNDNEAL